MFIKIAALLLVGSAAFAQTQSETGSTTNTSRPLSAAQPRSTPAKRSSPSTTNRTRNTNDEATNTSRKRSDTEPVPRATPNPLPTPAGADTPITRDEKPVKLGRTQEEIDRDRRAEDKAEGAASSTFGVAYNLSPLGFPVIFKHGPSVWWPAEGRWQLELGYLTGGLSLDQLGAEIGSATESLITLNARRYSSGGHFNWIIGLSHQSYDATLGRDLLSTVSNVQSSIDIVKTRTIGLQLGIGNRWEWSNFVVAADWFIINIPFMTSSSEAPALDYINDPNARARIEDAIAIMRRLPSVVLSKVTLGYEF